VRRLLRIALYLIAWFALSVPVWAAFAFCLLAWGAHGV
jgi:hypothetical protein